MTLPTFFLAGVPRAGTTSLYSYLSQHPDVYLSPIKEPTFFGAADLLSGPARDRVLASTARGRAALEPYLRGKGPPGAQPLVLDRDGYLELFRNVRDQIAIGEGSVSYFALPGAARAIRAAVPDARLMFVLRDPAERLFSRYLNARRGRPAPGFADWFRSEMTARDAWPDPLGVGRYATHLGRYFDAFPPEQLRIFLYEEYRADPRAVLRHAFEFLGVRPDHPVDVSRRLNQTMVPRFPRLARRLWRRPPASVGLDPADRRLVVGYYADEIRRTAKLIGRDLSAWLR